jgi:vitamin B12 transporter
MQLKHLMFAAATAVAAPLDAYADQQSTTVDELVVTARLAEPEDPAAGRRVIDRTAIEEAGPFASDVLKTVPGVSLSRSGPFGGTAFVRIRGGSSDKTLVLVDGVVVNDPTAPAGGFDFGGFDLFDVERLEILSGPQGSLWGSDAAAGVVALFTQPPSGVRFTAEAGAFATRRVAFAAGGVGPDAGFGLSLSAIDSDGVSKADVRDGAVEDDGFRSLTLSARGEAALPGGWRGAAGGRWSRSRVEYDSFGGPTGVTDGPDRSEQVSAAGWVEATGRTGPGGFVHSLRAEVFEMSRDDFGPWPFSTGGGRRALRWTAERSLASGSGLLFGVEAERADANGQARSAAAALVVGRFAPGPRASLTASVRSDRPEGYGAETTGRVAGAWSPGGGWRLSASWAQGFKAPSIFQTTFDCGFCTPPGPAASLRPERTLGWDAGVGWRGGRAEASATLWRLEVEDQIDFSFPVGYANIARARSFGLEAQGRLDLGGGWALSGGYAFTDAKDVSTGERLRKVPEHAGSAALRRTGERLRATATVRAESEQLDVYGTIRPFVVADLSAALRLDAATELTLRIENLGDRSYQEAFGYGEPGRSAYLGLRLRY